MLDDVAPPSAEIIRKTRRVLAVARNVMSDPEGHGPAADAMAGFLCEVTAAVPTFVEQVTKEEIWATAMEPQLKQAFADLQEKHPAQFAELIGLFVELGLGSLVEDLPPPRPVPSMDVASSFVAGAVAAGWPNGEPTDDDDEDDAAQQLWRWVVASKAALAEQGVTFTDQQAHDFVDRVLDLVDEARAVGEPQPHCINDMAAKRREVLEVLELQKAAAPGLVDGVQELFERGAFRHAADVAYAAVMLERGESMDEIAIEIARGYESRHLRCDPVVPN
jgi:hypothetical protein